MGGVKGPPQETVSHLESSKNRKKPPLLGLKEPGKEIVFPESPRDRTGEKRLPVEGRGSCQNSGAKAGKEQGRNTLTFLTVPSLFSCSKPPLT